MRSALQEENPGAHLVDYPTVIQIVHSLLAPDLSRFAGPIGKVQTQIGWWRLDREHFDIRLARAADMGKVLTQTIEESP